jgi:hypothetical protein
MVLPGMSRALAGGSLPGPAPPLVPSALRGWDKSSQLPLLVALLLGDGGSQACCGGCCCI